MLFRFGAGKQIGAVAFELQAGELRPLAPDIPAGPGQFEHLPGRLTGDQGLAEVAHRGAKGCGGAFEDADLETAFGRGVGMGQAKDAGADDQ